MSRLRASLVYANVMATIAVFMVLGGRDIRNASQTTSDILPGTANTQRPQNPMNAG